MTIFTYDIVRALSEPAILNLTLAGPAKISGAAKRTGGVYPLLFPDCLCVFSQSAAFLSAVIFFAGIFLYCRLYHPKVIKVSVD